jgi:hypothetical protein
MPRLQWSAFCGTFAGLVLLVLSGCQESSDGKEWVPSANAQQQITQVKGALDNQEQHVCSGVNPGQFRDSIVVPDNWCASSCQSWATSIGASHYQLGRLNQNGSGGVFSWCTMDSSTCWGC